MGGGALSNADHLLALRVERRDRQKNKDDANYATLKGLVGYLLDTNRRLILWAKNKSAWMSVRGTTVSDTVFSAT